MDTKTVCLPIKVPAGEYCWKFNTPGVCDYHENEGGHSRCTLHFDIKSTKRGILKDYLCEKLKVVA